MHGFKIPIFMVLWSMVIDSGKICLLTEVMTQNSNLGIYKLWDTADV